MEIEQLNNTDYFVLSVLEITPRYRTGELFTIKELSYYIGIDKSTISRSLTKLKHLNCVKVIGENPYKFTFDKEIIKKW